MWCGKDIAVNLLIMSVKCNCIQWWLWQPLLTVSATTALGSLNVDFSHHQHCVAQWLGCWNCNQQIMGSDPSHHSVECNHGEVVYTRASVTKAVYLVTVNGRRCLAAGKVTMGLALHWPCVKDISGSPQYRLGPSRGRWASACAL